ncbi:hypothetical protein HMPREF9997_00438 [Corynebacterium durum F0235]|uniref:Uncharacterized protein n=1 Tax=Corynebacterium durum F0235 TaxID=1035195 RepID=L1MKM6_9CORY|nr:hypothetical protein HMPREF9997_00438 [Corynebacterium durum F0235]
MTIRIADNTDVRRGAEAGRGARSAARCFAGFVLTHTMCGLLG